MPNQSFYKYKITNRETGEVKHFVKYPELKGFCDIPRTTLYRIFAGESAPKKWCDEFYFEQVRLPKFNLICYDAATSTLLI